LKEYFSYTPDTEGSMPYKYFVCKWNRQAQAIYKKIAPGEQFVIENVKNTR